MMNELKQGAIARITAVLSMYKQSKNLSREDNLIIKEYEYNLRVLNRGYIAHTYYKMIWYAMAVIAGFTASVLSHHVFGLIQ